jgi:hypothetical protein
MASNSSHTKQSSPGTSPRATSSYSAAPAGGLKPESSSAKSENSKSEARKEHSPRRHRLSHSSSESPATAEEPKEAKESKETTESKKEAKESGGQDAPPAKTMTVQELAQLMLLGRNAEVSAYLSTLPEEERINASSQIRALLVAKLLEAEKL